MGTAYERDRWFAKQTPQAGNAGAPGAVFGGQTTQPVTPAAGTQAAGYTPAGTYIDAGLSAEDKAKVESLGAQWRAAQAAGDAAAMDSLHRQAEAVRASYGYSGGADGSEYNALPSQGGYYLNRTGLPSYEAQTGAANRVYDAAKDVALAQLEAAYESSRIAAEADRAKIAGQYQQQANAAGANAAIAGSAFNEQAAASGLNTGAGSQARLAQNNALQGNLTAIRTAEANAYRDADTRLLQLYASYRNAVAEALASNEYARASALLDEYRTAAASAVDTAQAQASLDLQTAGFNRDTAALEREWAKQDMRSSAGGYVPTEDVDENAVDDPDAPLPPAPYEEEGATDQSIAQAAYDYMQQHPDTAYNSRTIDNWLSANGYSGDKARLFKAFMIEYGAPDAGYPRPAGGRNG